jgi:hypothetical protein
MQRCKSPTSTSIYHFLQKEGATASSVGLLASEKGLLGEKQLKKIHKISFMEGFANCNLLVLGK